MVTESCMLSVVMDTADVSLSTASKSPGSDDSPECNCDTADVCFIDDISDTFADAKYRTSPTVRMIQVKERMFIFTLH